MLDRGEAGGFAVAMVLMHHDRNARVDLDERVDHLRQHDVVGVAARSAARLDDHRGIDRSRRADHGEALLHVVDVERRNAVAMLGGVVQQLSQCGSGHRSPPA
jgi:hypothetical protein